MHLLYKGSVKSVYGGETEDVCYFEYSDRYSLFDWGEMPDHLESKGECLAIMGDLFFQILSRHQIPHHFLSRVDQRGQATQEPSRFLKVKSVPVIRPVIKDGVYDYSAYQRKPQTALVPLEIIFRFGIGRGSSVLKRVQEKPELLNQWKLPTVPEGLMLDEPLLDFSTKLEPADRYLTHAEAKELAGLSQKEWEDLKSLAVKVARTLKTVFADMHKQLWDGKIEMAFLPGANGERQFMVVDSIGLDELRIEKQGEILSKEFLREYYRKTPWYQELMTAKKNYEDFRSHCSGPSKLPSDIKKRAENMYIQFTNELSQYVLGRNAFSENTEQINARGETL